MKLAPRFKIMRANCSEEQKAALNLVSEDLFEVPDDLVMVFKESEGSGWIPLFVGKGSELYTLAGYIKAEVEDAFDGEAPLSLIKSIDNSFKEAWEACEEASFKKLKLEMGVQSAVWPYAECFNAAVKSDFSYKKDGRRFSGMGVREESESSNLIINAYKIRLHCIEARGAREGFFKGIPQTPKLDEVYRLLQTPENTIRKSRNFKIPEFFKDSAVSENLVIKPLTKQTSLELF